jgi:hypothetical protein
MQFHPESACDMGLRFRQINNTDNGIYSAIIMIILNVIIDK